MARICDGPLPNRRNPLCKLLAFLLSGVLTSLISNTTAGLACRLARGLALATSTVTLAKIAGFNSSDVFHNGNLQNIFCISIIAPK